jgi:hypothetical protein
MYFNFKMTNFYGGFPHTFQNASVNVHNWSLSLNPSSIKAVSTPELCYIAKYSAQYKNDLTNVQAIVTNTYLLLWIKCVISGRIYYMTYDFIKMAYETRPIKLSKSTNNENNTPRSYCPLVSHSMQLQVREAAYYKRHTQWNKQNITKL